MSHRPRPLLSVRLVGPTDIVTEQKAHLLTHLAEAFGDRATCRTSTHHADRSTEARVYLTVTAKEVPPR